MTWAPYPDFVNPGDNAWQLTAATLVGLMSVPGLAVLYGGVMQKRWSVNSMMLTFVAFCLTLTARCLWAFKMGFGNPIAHSGSGVFGTHGFLGTMWGEGGSVLGHVGEERPTPAGGLLPTVAWRVDGRVEWAIDGGVFTAGALLEWLSRDLGLAGDPAALAAAAADVEDSAGVRILPALAGVGAPWWKPEARAVIAGLTAGARPAHIGRAALDAIAWRVADVVAAVRETVPVEVLRVDGGLTRDPTLLRLQADAAGVPVERGAVDATAAGAAALAAVGAGIWESTTEIAERIPVGERIEPERDEDWRRAEHRRWRRFVERAVDL